MDSVGRCRKWFGRCEISQVHLRRGQEPGEETLKYQTDIYAGSLCEGLRVRTLPSGTCILT